MKTKKVNIEDYLDSISGNPYRHPEFPGVVIDWSRYSGVFRASNGFWLCVDIDFRDEIYVSYNKLDTDLEKQKEYIDGILRKRINRLFSLMGRTIALYKNKNVTAENICKECGIYKQLKNNKEI